ncbi:Smr/MutS family protein [Paralimibaculum aggregatum]|uniref:Smr/MutS family protein n=1 Tax=Paralimibaculum aggregatum TaxID=3036245 RepID=A0ABQ6LJL1_9RHOB|nr:Smr/MutS family protein [Limibaculum sp. NKW23]GMG83446.1 Smr/MutS family protein [Limibaculum sp. NKW23]
MGPGRRRRGLTPEERALWERVARTANPLKGPAPKPPDAVASPPAMPEMHPSDEPRRAPPAPATSLPRPGSRARALGSTAAPPVGVTAHGPPHPGPVGRPEPGLDRRTAERLRRGEREPDARIDLHGLTAARAHARLDTFVRRAIAERRRCLLVITGKGDARGGRRHHREDAPFMSPSGGVLREAAPKWLRSGPFARQIVGIYEAHRRHGGAGAFYVYLKKPGSI